MSPTFSVVVRTQGRRPRSLPEALGSIAAQTWRAHEVVVLVHDPDPEVRDRVAEAVTAVDGLPTSHVHSVHGGGRSAPLNAGVAHASGSHVAFLDDDDLAEPNWLAEFAAAATEQPQHMIRANTASQSWATDGSGEPQRATGPVEHPFADRFDLLAHFSHNETPICAIAVPTAGLAEHDIEFDDTLPVYEDWDFLMRCAMAMGVSNVTATTSLYRRLDSGNADDAATVAEWNAAHSAVLDKLSAAPLHLPAGDARRLASAHFVPGGQSSHSVELIAAREELQAITRSPWRWAKAFLRWLGGAVARRATRAR